MRQLNKLTAAQVKAAKYEGKDRKLSDGGGMYLYVTAHGRYWRLRYTRNGKETTLGLGVYPEVSLAQAREARDEAKRRIRQGEDPACKRDPEVLTLNTALDQWMAARNWAASHADKVDCRLNRHIRPMLGDRPLAEITTVELLERLRSVEKQSVDIAHRCRQHVKNCYEFAMASGVVQHNPAAGLQAALKAKPRGSHFAATTDAAELTDVLQQLWAHQGTAQVRAALRLTPMLLVRPGELRRMRWAHLDLDDALWSLPGTELKMRNDHLVPLPKQATAELLELRAWTGDQEYVFGGRPGRPMSENTITAALKSKGYALTAHGFRATARTMLDEVLGWRPDVIEHQLAHAVRDPNGRAYNRTTFIGERRRMMQAWADYLDSLRLGTQATG